MNTKEFIYLDYAASTPIDPRVAQAMIACLSGSEGIANPSASSHVLGKQAAACVAKARECVAELINAQADEIIWTSGATESNNLVLKGIAHANRYKGDHIITGRTEHKSVLATCEALEREGFKITYLSPKSKGLFSTEQLKNAITDNTILISLMQVNNEIGVIQPIAKLAEIASERNIFFHTDAAQSAGKIPIDVQQLSVDALSLSAHKVYGPKGIGALYLRKKSSLRLHPQMHGGEQEGGLRSGTLATHQCVGMGAAFALALKAMPAETAHILQRQQQFLQGIKACEPRFFQQDLSQNVPHIVNLYFEGVSGEALLNGLSSLAISTGSACNSARVEPSHVLRALGCNDAVASNALRFSFGRYITEADIDFAVEEITKNVARLRQPTK